MNKTENKLTQLLKTKNKLRSVYFTAGYPRLEDTATILLLLQKHGADLIEVGIPFSDSLMDGQVIQEANTKALENGMSLQLLFQQLEEIKDKITIPLILMGSMNPVYQYGFEKFFLKCKEVGVQGTIIPEMTLKEYHNNYQSLYKQSGLSNIFMITPQTSAERVKAIDESSGSFIYMISSNSTTGNKKNISQSEDYFRKIKAMQLRTPLLTGFNIQGREDMEIACKYSKGVIIGSAFVKAIAGGVEEEKVKIFMQQFE